MNLFDLAVVAVVALSTLFAFSRGIVRELIALATWIVGIVAAFQYSEALAAWFGRLDIAPAAKHALAFALILIAIVIAGAFVSRLLARVIKTIGLGFVDRMLGAVFGAVRGIATIVIFALIAGVTALPKQDWWQNAALGRPLAEAAVALKPYLPREWAEHLDFSAPGTMSADLGSRIALRPSGEPCPCVES